VFAVEAFGQDHLPTSGTPVDPCSLSTQAVLHAADMISTAACLQYTDAHEGNPWLAPLSDHPVALASASGAIDITPSSASSTRARLHRR
jgi:hypothetical protein